MLSNLFVLLTLAAACGANTSGRTIQVGPINKALYAGPTVWLNCTATPGDAVKWNEYYSSPPLPSLISDGDTLSPAHPNYAEFLLNVDAAAAKYDLGISPTDSRDGGLYECTDGTAGRKAELVILTGEVSCPTTIPGNGIVILNDYHTIDCTQTFVASAGIAPLMTWSGPGVYNDHYFRQNGSAVSGVQFNAQKAMDAGKFALKINFTAADFGGENTATNAPDFTDTWSSVTLYVHYGPEDVYYTPVKAEYLVGDIITCYADANPMPTYTWTDLNTLVEYNSQSITLTAEMVGPLELRCRVVNSVSTANINVNSTVKPQTTTAPPTTTTTTEVPAVSNCMDLTGRWEHDRSEDSKAVLCLYVDNAQNGDVTGLLWNDTETEAYYMEIFGRTRANVYDETGFVGIWPLEVGVSSFAAECHRCYGVESLLVNPVSRSNTGAMVCDDGGEVLYGPQYNFHRVPPSYPCASGTTWKQMRDVSRKAAARRLKRRAESEQSKQ